jgi:cytoskeleton protein RodZ
MSSFGEHLRQQRQMRGVSLEEIVAITKISRRHLQALEDEQFDLLPGGIFNKSYVRGYAKCVGIDEDEALAQYLEASGETPPDARKIAQQHASLHSDRRPERSGFPLLPVLILLVVVAGGIGGWKMYTERRNEKQQATMRASTADTAQPPTNNAVRVAGSQPASEPQSQVPENSAPATAAAATSGELTPPRAAPVPTVPSVRDVGQAAAAPFEITVHFKERAWVSIKADNDYAVRGIVAPPLVKTVRASTRIVFYTSNAAALEVAFDGKNVPLAAGSNAPETLVFDEHGLMPKVNAQ